jgi:hypothetical protein
MERNKHDIRGALELGIRAEKLFAKTCCQNGTPVVKASPEDNELRHIDFWREYNGGRWGVDVKSLKRVHGTDNRIQDRFVWLEFKGVEDTKGWLYGSYAVHIAFELKDSFVIVNRKDLIALGERLVDRDSEPVNDPSFALNRLYTRHDRNDLIAMIYSRELYTIPHHVLNKREGVVTDGYTNYRNS